MARFSRPFLIASRISKLKETVKINTQEIREKLLANLENIFENAVKLARGEVTVDEEKLTLRQREAWARVAAYTAQVIESVAKGFDERRVDVQLDELERLVNEAKAKGKAGKTEKRDASATGGNTS